MLTWHRIRLSYSVNDSVFDLKKKNKTVICGDGFLSEHGQCD